MNPEKWERFIKRLKKGSEKDDNCLIFMEEFEKILVKHKVELTKEDKDRLVQAFPGRNDGFRKSINISKLYE